MAVFHAIEDNEIIISCKCGCDEGLRVKIDVDTEDEDYCYQTYLSGNWYAEQGSFMKKLRKIWAILRNKDFYYSEIVMSKNEWKAYKKWVDEH